MQAKHGSNVHISNAMPDIESLMQQWPSEMEQQLHTIKLPDASLVSSRLCRTTSPAPYVILSYCILFCSVLFYSTLFYSIT